MIPKNTMLISAALTAFMLVILGGVATALKQPVAEQAATQQTTVAEQTTITAVPTQQVVMLTPQEAAAAAASFLGRQDLYSVESSTWNNIEAYKVVFSSGDVVYVGLDGQILSAVSPTAPAQQAVSIPSTTKPSKNHSNAAAAQPAPQSNGEHETEGDHD